MSEPPPTVLVCDDFSTSRLILGDLLGQQGYRMLFARDGREGVELAEAELPDLVLCDVMMPVMNGFELVMALRANPITAEMPILLVTGLEDRESRLRGIEAGADDFINKNFDKMELLTRVKSILRLNRYRRLHRERVKFEWVVEHADDGFLTLDASECMSYANEKARRDLSLSDPPNTVNFWRYASSTHSLIGNLEDDGPVYLIRPESPSSLSAWYRVDRFSIPHATGNQTVIRLRDVTDERRMRQSLWGYRATQKYGIKLKVPRNGSLAQTAESGRGVRTDEWLRILQTWVSLAAPAGSSVLVAGMIPARGLILPMDGFALLAAELIQFVRHPSTAEPGAATLVISSEADFVIIVVRCPVRYPNLLDLRQRWLPQYRGRGGGMALATEADPFTGEAASLVWNVGGRVETRVDTSSGWVEVRVWIPLQPGSASEILPVSDQDDHSLIGA